MELPVDAWFKAIPVRASRRTYEARPLRDEELVPLENACREFRPFPESRAELVREPSDGVFKGILGNYGRVTGAPCYLAFVGDLTSTRAQECTGYTGEGLILQATALGLDTCWVGGFFGRRAVSAQVRLGENEAVLAVSPVGFARGKKSVTDRTFKFFAGSKNRNPLRALVQGGLAIDPRIRKGLEAARLAPSAYNRQPWRFGIEDGAVVIRTDKEGKADKISRHLDCGIAMLHFELGVRAAGLSGSWEFLPTPDVARFRFGLA
jgi:nitroreductase